MPFVWSSGLDKFETMRLKGYQSVPLIDVITDILNFLQDETRIAQALRDFVRDYPITTAESLEHALGQVESHNGFSHNVKTAKMYLDPDAFLTYVNAKRPIFDQAALVDHGAQTHRLQWALICRSIKPPADKTMADAYAAFAHSLAKQQVGVGNLWDLVLDAGASNARSPEHFCSYMLEFDDSSVRRIAELSRLLAKGNNNV